MSYLLLETTLKYSLLFYDIRVQVSNQSNFFERFDGVGELAEKIDPTLVKTYSMNELSTQIIFAAANGDMLELRRCFLRSLYILTDLN